MMPSALLIYKLAVGAVAIGTFSVTGALPTFALVVLGSVVVGWVLAWLPSLLFLRHIEDAPTSVILQFVMTFCAWLLAERLGLSGVVTIVVFGLTTAQRTSHPMPARLRVTSFTIWESVTVVLNILAFSLIGLQIRPILEALDRGERLHAIGAALAILAIVIAVRFIWVMMYGALARLSSSARPTMKGTLVVAWSGMRGIVTLAAALALPADFPHRDFILLTAFVVVLGTLVIQGLTLRPLLVLLRLPRDRTVETEISQAREAALKAAITELQGDDTPAAERLKREYSEALRLAERGHDPHDSPDKALRRRALSKSRRAILDLRSNGAIGDAAYRRVEEELDWLELSARPAEGPD